MFNGDERKRLRRSPDLGATERDVFVQLLEGAGKPVKRSHIIAELGLKDKGALSRQITGIKNKLGADVIHAKHQTVSLDNVNGLSVSMTKIHRKFVDKEE